MKFSTTALTALAPVALAKSVHNHYEKRNAPIIQEGVHKGLTEVIVIWVNPGAKAETTTMAPQLTVTQTVTADLGHPTVVPGLEADKTIVEGATEVVVGMGATHEVTVGGPAGLVFTPDQVRANVGDMVVFTFLGQNHTATQSTFDLPCEPLAGGMDTGFQPNPDNTIIPAPQVAMQVMVDTPLWFFCQQGPHCGKGMTFSINPSVDKTHAMFQSKAIANNGNGAGSVITGGEAPPAAAAPADPAGSLAPLNPTPVVGDAATATNPGDIVQGTGTILPDGSCSCAVVVGAGSFPAVGSQGLGNVGGMPGALPIEMAEVI